MRNQLQWDSIVFPLPPALDYQTGLLVEGSQAPGQDF